MYIRGGRVETLLIEAVQIAEALGNCIGSECSCPLP